MPLLWGWYAEVRAFLDPKSVKRFFHNCDSNCHPRSVIIQEGTPYRAIQPSKNALATDSALMLVSGMAPGHLVKQSTHVRRYVNPCDGGRGPTKSTWTISKRASGVGKVAIAAVECCWILARWHCKQARVHCLTSALMPGHTNRAVTSF